MLRENWLTASVIKIITYEYSLESALIYDVFSIYCTKAGNVKYDLESHSKSLTLRLTYMLKTQIFTAWRYAVVWCRKPFMRNQLVESEWIELVFSIKGDHTVCKHNIVK